MSSLYFRLFFFLKIISIRLKIASQTDLRLWFVKVDTLIRAIQYSRNPFTFVALSRRSVFRYSQSLRRRIHFLFVRRRSGSRLR